MSKAALVGLAAAAVLVAAVSAWPRSGAGPAATPSMFGPPRELVLYGHAKTLTRKGARYGTNRIAC